MAKLTLHGDWGIAKGEIKQRWAKLTDDDLTFVEGKEDELVGRIQKSTGESREAIEDVLAEACGYRAPTQRGYDWRTVGVR